LSRPLRFHEYNPNWVNDFSQIKVYLESKLVNLYTEIHHVGSTSVKGLGAKPIIDIDIEYEDNIDLIIKVLTNNGYEYQGFKGIEGRHTFRYKSDDLPLHHLYAMHKDNEELERHLRFRDALRMSNKYKKMYHELKDSLIKKNRLDRVLYTDSKTELVNKILEVSKIMKQIVFAGGCFWGVEAYFKMIEGVTETEVGYINGLGETTYKDVCEGSGHAEAVHIVYDEEQVSLKKLLDHLFNIIDPTSINKQGPDIGVQYRTGIYNYQETDLNFINNYFSVRQKEYKRPIAIELATNLQFYPAEENHQDYLDKNKNGYCHVDLGSHKNVE